MWINVCVEGWGIADTEEVSTIWRGVLSPFDKLVKAMQSFLQNNVYVYKCKTLYLILGIYNFFQD